MAGNERINQAMRVAGWGGESGMIVTVVGVVPVIFLGTYIAEDFGVAVILAAYGLLFGLYLSRRLPRAGAIGPEHANLLRFAPPAATVAGFVVMRAVMGASGAEEMAAVHGLLFGGVAGLMLGFALLRLPLALGRGTPLPAAVVVPAALLAAGAAMGIVAGFVMSFAIGWLFAMPVWLLGMGAAIGYLLAPPAADG